MKRYTERDKNGEAYIKPGYPESAEIIAAAQRLAAYEDSGYLPEEVAAICKSGGIYVNKEDMFLIARALHQLKKYQEAEKPQTEITKNNYESEANP
jgi:hypothetical protein